MCAATSLQRALIGIGFAIQTSKHTRYVRDRVPLITTRSFCVLLWVARLFYISASSHTVENTQKAGGQASVATGVPKLPVSCVFLYANPMSRSFVFPWRQSPIRCANPMSRLPMDGLLIYDMNTDRFTRQLLPFHE